ncbi:VOC family protein [Pelagibacterium lacus]|uniref:VOC family protein n=1 Tax=Pelagibacterium lacus TaxID=2282655 RepID=A0A369W3Q4_9HYPH|nr:VOC family protein [Pelagibacterium lacus]RDE08505.1 VOC family protein [Pelagibacterium lacus]
MTIATDFFDMSAAPMRVGTVRLKVRDLDSVSAYYQKVLGLGEIAKTDREATLGTGRTPLLVLKADPALAPGDRRQAGLFHTAFLMPTRADLAHWVGHIAESGIRIQGASDHIVSEAFYLADPEGNGIEVYADRPVAQWRGRDGKIQMTTEPLDIQDLLTAGSGAPWSGFPQAGSIGHVHLQVGDTAAADRFYRDVLGFDIAADYPGASFYGSGGYHHQLAGNAWNSRGAAQRPAGMTGLDSVELIVRDAATIDAIVARAESAGLEATKAPEGTTLRDPWGIAITLRT